MSGDKSEPSPPPESAPGWYPNPSGAANQRYWDGDRWTVVSVPSTGPSKETGKLPTWMVVTGIVVAVIVGLAVIGAVTGDDDKTDARPTTPQITVDTTPPPAIEPTSSVAVASIAPPPIDATPTTSSAVDKYTQTWPTPYGETTCAQFTTEMTSAQRWAMAADMLTNARNLKTKTGLPPDDMITEFEGGLRNVCVIDSMTMTDAGTGLYMTEPRFHP